MFLRKSFLLFHRNLCGNITSCRLNLCLNHQFSASNCKYSFSCTSNVCQPSVGINEDLVRRKFSKLHRSKIVDDPVKELSHEISKSDRFIKMIRLEPKLDEKGVSNILGNYSDVKEIILRSSNVVKDIKSSEEFKKFIKALQENISKLDHEKLIITLSLFYCFKLPKNDFFTTLMRAIIEKLHDLSLGKAVFLLELAKTIDKDENDELRNELIEELKFRIENEVIEKLKRRKNLSDEDVLEILRYARLEDCSHWPDEMLTLLIDAALEAENIYCHSYFLASCFSVIHHLKNQNDLNSAREKVFKKIYEFLEIKPDLITYGLCVFIKTYSDFVFASREPFDEEFFSDVMEYCCKNRRTLKQLFLLIGATALSNYLIMDVVKKATFFLMSKRYAQDVPIGKIDWGFYEISLELLSVAYGWKKIRGELLINIQSALDDLPILNNINSWKVVSLERYLRITVSLASMEIYSEDLLDLLREKINEIDVEKKESRVSYFLLIIHQAVTLLYKKYPKPFLSEKVVLAAMNKLYGSEAEIPDEYKTFKKDINETLLEVIGDQKSCLLTDQYNKYGHYISFVLAANDKMELFDFVDEDIKFGEDVSLPKGYRLIAILPVLSKHYTRNDCVMKSYGRIRINSLQALGYKVVPILETVWSNQSDEKKKIYLRNAISAALSDSSEKNLSGKNPCLHF